MDKLPETNDQIAQAPRFEAFTENGIPRSVPATQQLVDPTTGARIRCDPVSTSRVMEAEQSE